jgi:putative flippase GtrA
MSIRISDLILKNQIILYAMVGGICSSVDILIFYLFHLISNNLLISSIASFIIATCINYLLSRKFVFTPGRYEIASEFSRLFAVSAVGLLLNTAVVYMLTHYIETTPIFSKILAIPIAFMWNFLARKFLVFHRHMPLK